MAFGNISTFYLPTAANAGASQWGSDVRKLLSSVDASNDETTVTDHGTGANNTRTCDPYTTTTADLTQADYGWAVTPSDMNSVSGARRFFPAGNHTLTIRTNSSQAMTGNFANYVFYIYRVGPAPGRTRTLLGSTTGASFNYGTVPSIRQTQTISVNPGEVILEPDETIQYSLEHTSPGLVITGRLNRHSTGSQGGVDIRIDQPGLATRYDETLAATMKGAAGISKKVELSLSATMAGVAALARTISANRTLAATMTGGASIVRQVGKPIAAVMVGNTAIVRKVSLSLAATMAGVAAMVRKTSKTLAATMAGVPGLSRTITAYRALSATMSGSPSLARAITARRTIAAVMLGRGGGRVDMSWEVLNRITGGGGSTFIYPQNFYDD